MAVNVKLFNGGKRQVAFSAGNIDMRTFSGVDRKNWLSNIGEYLRGGMGVNSPTLNGGPDSQVPPNVDVTNESLRGILRRGTLVVPGCTCGVRRFIAAFLGFRAY